MIKPKILIVGSFPKSKKKIYGGIFKSCEILYNSDGSVKGVATQDMGIDKDGNKKDSFEPGIELHGKVTVFAEGCRGHLGKLLIDKFNLSDEKILNSTELVLKKFGK